MTEQGGAHGKGMRPIWYFVGWLLMIVGAIVVLSGAYGVISPPPVEQRTVLYELHTGLWWGALVALLGAILFWANKNEVIE